MVEWQNKGLSAFYLSFFLLSLSHRVFWGLKTSFKGSNLFEYVPD